MKSVIQESKERCYMCGAVVGLEEHHIFGASNRKKSESNGMKLIRLNSKVREVVESLNIDLVVMERPAGLFKSAIITVS